VRLNDASINSFCNRPFSRWRKAPLGTNQSEAIDVPSGKCQQKPMNKIPHIFEKGLFFACSFEEINGRDDPAISWWIGGKASSFGSQCAAFRWYISICYETLWPKNLFTFKWRSWRRSISSNLLKKTRWGGEWLINSIINMVFDWTFLNMLVIQAISANKTTQAPVALRKKLWKYCRFSPPRSQHALQSRVVGTAHVWLLP